MFDPTTKTTPTLATTAEAFREWRVVRIGRGTTPDPLREQAVALLDEHSRAEITQALGINSTAFGQWVRALRGDAALPGGQRRRRTPGLAMPEQFVELRAADSQRVLPPCTAPALAPSSANRAELIVDLPNGTRIIARSADCAERLLAHLCLPGASTAGADA